MKVKEVLPLLHNSQFINIYYLGNLVTTGLRNEIRDESYLESEVSYIYSEDMDSISIEVK